MSKKRKPSKQRSNVARGMIAAGTGRSQTFRHRSDRRAKDARRSFTREDWGDRRTRGTVGHWIVTANTEDGTLYLHRNPGGHVSFTSNRHEAHRFTKGRVAAAAAARVREHEKRERAKHGHEQFLFVIKARHVKHLPPMKTRTHHRRPRPKQKLEREWRELYARWGGPR